MSQDFADILRSGGKLDERDLARAQGLADACGDPLHLVLCRLGIVTEEDMAEALMKSLDLPAARKEDFPEAPILVDLLTPSFLRTCRVLPLAEKNGHVFVAMADPLDDETVRALQLQLGKPIRRCVAVPVELERQLARLYDRGDGGAPGGDVVTMLGDDIDASDVERLKDMASEVPVIRFVNQTIASAVAERASDIHIEPYPGELRIRYRVDGLLRQAAVAPPKWHAGIISRIKIMASLDIVERRRPQDGRCKVHVQGRAIDIRVSCVPTMHGESIVLRILDKASAPLDLERLGLGLETLERTVKLLGRADGILLVTGPTGSGKTTTLYAALQRLNTPERNLITIEDPIEYQLQGINQIEVKSHIGVDFARMLRSVLRHDPDVIMVGEIRDLETAQISIQAALTGHLVLSTLHTNNAASAITRLADIGIEPYLMTSALRGILAQRLLRTLCLTCREPMAADAGLVKRLGLDKLSGGKKLQLYHARGCADCAGSGYRGRTCVAELLVVTDTLRATILKHTDAASIEKVALDEGLVGMRVQGLQKALDGVTTIEEVLRVTQEA